MAYTKLYNWLADAIRNPKIRDARLDAEFGEIQSTIGYADWAISAVTYGVVGDNSTDNTAQLQEWIDACISEQKPGFLPAGIYRIASQLEIDGSVQLFGANRDDSVIQLSSTSANLLVVTTAQPVFFHDIGFYGQYSTAIGGSLITIDAPNAEFNYLSQIQRCSFIGGYKAINLVKVGSCDISHCFFQGLVSTNIEVANDTSPDAGDGTIAFNTFNMAAGSTGIDQRSAGGLRIIGNKIGGQSAYGFRLNLDSGVNTSELAIIGNSIEGQTSACIDLVVGSGVSFGTIQIVGNQMGAVDGTIINQQETSGFHDIIIAGNNIANVASTGGVGIRVNGTTNLIVSDNTLWGTGTSDTGIAIGSSTVNAKLHNNFFNDWSTPIDNDSTSTIVIPASSLDVVVEVAVDFNAANTDHAITVPIELSGYIVRNVFVTNSGSTASLTTARGGLFSSTGGGGITIVTDAALSAITQKNDGTAANSTSFGLATVCRFNRANTPTLYWRTSTAQGAAATGRVMVVITPVTII